MKISFCPFYEYVRLVIAKKSRTFTGLSTRLICTVHPEIVTISQDRFFEKLSNLLGLAYVVHKFTVDGGQPPAIRVTAWRSTREIASIAKLSNDETVLFRVSCGTVWPATVHAFCRPGRFIRRVHEMFS